MNASRSDTQANQQLQQINNRRPIRAVSYRQLLPWTPSGTATYEA